MDGLNVGALMDRVTWHTLFFLFFLFPFHVTAQSSQILDLFLECLITNTEAGYVFFGSKPVCYWKVSSTNNISIGSALHEINTQLRIGAKWWLAAHCRSKSAQYVMTVSTVADGFEILCLNKEAFIKAVRKNLPLFQYTLGIKLSPEILFETLASGKGLFYDTLQGNNTLVGILLGFGGESAIAVSRSEKISDLTLTKPDVPNKVFDEITDPTSSWNDFVLSMIFPDNVIERRHLYPPGFGFASLGEESKFLEGTIETCSHLLRTYSPRIIFGNVYGSPEQQALIQTYENEQKDLVKLIHSGELSQQVLAKLEGVTFSAPENWSSFPPPAPSDLAMLLIEHMRFRHFDDFEMTKQGIVASAKAGLPPEGSLKELNEFYDLWALNKLQEKILSVQSYFDRLSQDSSYTSIQDNLFFKIIEAGSGPTFSANNSQGTFSFAIWPADHGDEIPYTAQRHTKLDLNKDIPGLSEGILGMHEGETREIIIHPEYGYGLCASFDKWQPLKILVHLDQIDSTSPSLVHAKHSSRPHRSVLLSGEDKQRLSELNRVLSYREALDFLDFYKIIDAGITSEEFIAELAKLWNQPACSINGNALDLYTLQLWKNRHEQEQLKTTLLFQQINDGSVLVPNKLLIKLEHEGKIPIAWPVVISLEIQDLNGTVLKSLDHYSLTLEEVLRWNQGLQKGLLDRKKGDCGQLFIHPDLSDVASFRNPLSRKGLIVSFAISS